MPTVSETLKLAVEHHRAHRLDQAMEVYHQILTQQPQHPEALYGLGVLAQQTGQHQTAEKFLRALLTVQPESVKGWFSLGNLHQVQGQLSEAVEAYQQALAIEPDSVAVHKNLGYTLQIQGKWEEAATCYQKALKLQPDCTEAEINFGNALHTQENFSPEKSGCPQATIPSKQFSSENQVLRERLADRSGDNLAELALAFGSDKEGAHYYTKHYQFHFESLRRKKLNILEIGIGGYKNPRAGGESLRMWKAYFPNSRIFGIDIYDKTYHDEDRIKTFRGSQVDEEFLQKVVEEIGEIDIIIDDGSHYNQHVIATFKILFPLMNHKGIYVIEDLQTSYWEKFGNLRWDGSKDLTASHTSMNFFKGLIDGLNYEEFMLDEYTPSYFDKHIISMHFYHNLVFIYKGLNNEGSNILGKQSYSEKERRVGMATVSEALKLAVEHHRAHRLAPAMEIYNKILEQQPQQPEALYGLGVLAQQTGEYQRAEKFLKTLLGVQPESVKAWFSLGNLRQVQGQLPEAVEAYQQALAIEPDSVAVHNNLGYTLQLQGKWEEAVTCYQKALKLQPDCVEAQVSLGNALYAQGKLSSEKQAYYAGLNYDLGVARQKAGDLKTAVAYYRQAIAMKPDLVDADDKLGVALQEQGELYPPHQNG